MSCPSRQELRAFNEGRLAAERGEAIAGHVATCPDCESALRDLTERDEVGQFLRALTSASPATASAGLAPPNPFAGDPEYQRMEGHIRRLPVGAAAVVLETPPK